MHSSSGISVFLGWSSRRAGAGLGVGRPGPQDHLRDCLSGTERHRPARGAQADSARFSSFFSDSCTWPDHPRKRAIEHFINAPRDFDRFLAAQCPMPPKCLFTAITADLEVLRTSTDDQAKLDALKFLGHWIGDLHQPLHVSFEDDRGGGKIKELGPCFNNLHSVWDTCIIERGLGDRPRDVAHDLLQEITASDRASWQATAVEEWANESFEIVRRATVGYCVRVGNKGLYEAGNEQFDTGETEKTVTVDANYLATHGPIVADRLKRAGIRLGHLLNTSLGQ
jgi:nuclease S1